MQIIAHRGFWTTDSEKNSLKAFERSFAHGFGLETDIRDFNGHLVISHDPPKKNEDLIFFDDFLSFYKSFDENLFLALNIKSDGLAKFIQQALKEKSVDRYFVFDMSVPDMIHYKRNSSVFFTRRSEIEKDPALYFEASGVWLDELNNHWINQETIRQIIERDNKFICIVSPELHGRKYKNEWTDYKLWWSALSDEDKKRFLLCTDFPDKAREFFKQ